MVASVNRGRFARLQGEGWLPPAEVENAANMALRLPGGAPLVYRCYRRAKTKEPESGWQKISGFN